MVLVRKKFIHSMNSDEFPSDSMNSKYFVGMNYRSIAPIERKRADARNKMERFLLVGLERLESLSPLCS